MDVSAANFRKNEGDSKASVRKARLCLPFPASAYRFLENQENLLTYTLLFGIVLFADCTVGIAQVVECQTVDLVVVGSNPTTHPEPKDPRKHGN